MAPCGRWKRGADAGRLVRRFGRRCRRADRAGRDRHRHRRLDPPAAAFTGITGIKPTYGRCSRWGIVAFASSLDQAGPMARDVRDCAILLETMAGFDPKDSTSLDLPVPNWEASLSADIRGKRIGIPKEYRIEGVPAEVDRVWEQGIAWLRDAGAEIVEVSLPHTRYALPAYYIIAPAEASSNLARYDGVKYGLRELPAREMGGGGLADMYATTRAAGFGAEVKRRIMIGTYVLSAGFYDAYFNRAQKVRALIARDFERVWNECDLLLTTDCSVRRFRARREVGRSDRHVPERRFRRSCQPCRAAGHVGPRGAQ
jgi:aspartyl-tRNA(Asn)/glutamyl-tRNA(Gln) amidotransferase subunit A